MYLKNVYVPTLYDAIPTAFMGSLRACMEMDTVRVQPANERTKHVLSRCVQQCTNTHAYIQLCSVVLVL